jgi:dipeptidyl aminopeptidase/acylaminoacyl peptidase
MPARDPELEGLFADPADLEVLRLLQASRPASPPLEPHFRTYLRGRLMAEAHRTLPTHPRRRWFTLAPLPALATVAAAFLVVLGYQWYVHNQTGGPAAPIDVTAQLDKTNVALAEPIRLKFSGPVDRAAVVESIVIQPATQYTTRWEGQTLVVIPLHQLAANTSYSVELRPAPAPRPSATTGPAPTVTPTPVIVRFVTAPAPPPPVAPTSYTSANLTFADPSRLLDAGTFGTATWAAGGQILVTRPVSPDRTTPKPSGSGTAAGAAAASSAAPKVQDLWLVSPRGVPIRKIASGVLDPVIAPRDGKIVFWRWAGDRYLLMMVATSATGGDGTQLATSNDAPVGPPVWIGTDRIGYAQGGALHLVDLQGNPVILNVAILIRGALAVSSDGHRLAADGPAGPAVFDLTAGTRIALPAGASAFSWSPRGDLAFAVTQGSATALQVLDADGVSRQIATSPPGETWANFNWSPDSRSLLFTSRSAAPNSATARAFLIDATGTGLRQVGSLAYETLDWSPDGSQVLFTRRDETGQPALWTATITIGAPSELEKSQQDAIAAVKTFMAARLARDGATAEAQLGPAALSAYQTGGLTLISPVNPSYERWYPVTVQLVKPDSFLIGVRIVEASGSVETGFFEETLTVTRHEPRFLIDTVQSNPLVSLAHPGPSVVSVEVRQDATGQRVLIHFDSDLTTGSVSTSSILIRDSRGKAQPVTELSYDQETHLATLSVKLSPDTYKLVVTTGIQDIHQKPLAQEYSQPLVIRTS